MEQRINFQEKGPGAVKTLFHTGAYLKKSSIEEKLQELVSFRVSQINGCAYCLDMHGKDARAHGETEQRLYALSAWRETPFFTTRERAALAWAESLTLIPQAHAADAEYDAVRKHFSDTEVVELSIAISLANFWNRMAGGFRRMPVLTKG